MNDKINEKIINEIIIENANLRLENARLRATYEVEMEELTKPEKEDK